LIWQNILDNDIKLAIDNYEENEVKTKSWIELEEIGLPERKDLSQSNKQVYLKLLKYQVSNLKSNAGLAYLANGQDKLAIKLWDEAALNHNHIEARFYRILQVKMAENESRLIALRNEFSNKELQELIDSIEELIIANIDGISNWLTDGIIMLREIVSSTIDARSSKVNPKSILNSKHKIEPAIFDEDFKNIFLNSISALEFRGLINIDGGHVGIATEWLPTCMECDNNYFEKKCDICGRNTENYVDFRSGRGDGCYPVYSIFASEDNPLLVLGSLILFDFEKGLHSIGQLFSGQINELNELEDQDEFSPLFEEFGNLPNIIFDLYKNNLQIYELCELKSSLASSTSENEFWRKNLIVIGESGEGIDSDSSLVNSTNIGAGNFKVYLVGDRDKKNNNIFIPGIAFILESNFCEQIGLVSDLIPKLDIKAEKELWNNSYVASYVGNPQSDVAFYCNFIIWNILRNFSLSDEDLNHMHEYVSNNAASWLMMLNHSKPSSANLNMLKQIIDGSGLDPNVIHKSRGQFNRELFDFKKESS
jgi:hypothetical protein